MCGIAGAFGPGETLALAKRMGDALAHRGPDDQGLIELHEGSGRPVGAVSSRRLAVLDLSESGHQPMTSPDGRFALVYNGEIYNHRELRERLVVRGEVFTGSSDTEVLLRGWARWGVEFLQELQGMYAFAIWDRQEGMATLGRDPLGIKPLYYAEVGPRLAFASELRALLRSGAVPAQLSRAGVRAYLSAGAVAEPGTIVAGIRSLPPGHTMAVRVSGSGAILLDPPKSQPGGSLKSWFETIEPSPHPETELGRLRDVLRDSVVRHLVSDVPIAFLLSGGIDSTALVGLAASCGRRDIETFTVRFQAAGFDEGRLAREVADRLGVSHHEVSLDQNALLELLPAAFSAMDQPTIDGFNTYIVSRAVRQAGMKVAISGLGGDELFGGYPSFRRAARYARLWGLPALVRTPLSAALRKVPNLRVGQAADALRQSDAGQGAYVASRTLFDRRRVRMMTGGEAERRLVPLAGVPPTRQARWLELSDYTRNMLLRDTDVFSMAVGLEMRVPFLDLDVVRASLRLEEAAMGEGRRPKSLLVRALGNGVPRAVWDRDKMGFAIPYERWLKGALRDVVGEGLAAAGLERVGIRAGPARSIWKGFLGGRKGVGWSRPWSLYVLVRWAEENGAFLATEPA